MQMPFGKYRGWDIESIPLSYLEWLIENVHLRDPYLQAEVEARVGIDAPDFDDEPTASGWKKTATGGNPFGSGSGTKTKSSDTAVLRLELSDIVDRWQRQMARRFHPDRGGTEEAMKAVNQASAELKTAIDEAFKRRI